MIESLLQSLAGPAPGKAGGLAAMTAGAAGASLLVKCKYTQAANGAQRLQELALKDGDHFENYLRARRAGEQADSLLVQATETPLRAAELSLELLEQLPRAREVCPKCMLADLAVGAYLLDASARGNTKLVKTNLRLFQEKWGPGEERVASVVSRLAERDTYLSIFRRVRSVAVIGISEGSEKPAFYVPGYLKEQGYRILGVHPRGTSRLAEKTATSLQALGESPDLVLVFRRSESVPEHLDDLLEVRPGCVWMQQGIHHSKVAEALCDVGITVVSDRCAKLEHEKLRSLLLQH